MTKFMRRIISVFLYFSLLNAYAADIQPAEVVNQQLIDQYGLDFSNPEIQPAPYALVVGSDELIAQGHNVTIGALYLVNNSDNTTELISKTLSGQPAITELDFDASQDFNRIAYSSKDPEIVSGDFGDSEDVFVYDRSSGQTFRVEGLAPHNGPVSGLRVSPTGNHIVFESSDFNFGQIVGAYLNNENIIYIYDINQMQLSSVRHEGSGSGATYLTTLSKDAISFNRDGTKFFFREFLSGFDFIDCISMNEIQTNTTSTIGYCNYDDFYHPLPAVKAIDDSHFVYHVSHQTSNYSSNDSRGYALAYIYNVETGVITDPGFDRPRLWTHFAGTSRDRRYALFYSSRDRRSFWNYNTAGMYIDRTAGEIRVFDTLTGLSLPASAVQRQAIQHIEEDEVSGYGCAFVYVLSPAYFDRITQEFPCTSIDDHLHSDIDDYISHSEDTFNLDTADIRFHNSDQYITFEANAWYLDESIAYDDFTIPYARDTFVVANPFLVDDSINLIGEPVIDGSSESGVFIWRTIDGRTLMQVVAGNPAQSGQITGYQGSIVSGSTISSLLPVGLESNDGLIQSTMNRIDFELFAQRPWTDRISFVANIDESLCIDLNTYPGGLYLGPDKVEVTPPYDVHSMAVCENGPVPKIEFEFEIERVSVSSNAEQGNSGSSVVSSSVSADGRFVTFASSSNTLVIGDNNGRQDIFVHDRQTGETELVSVASNGSQGNGGSSYSSISSDGRMIAFISSASNLVDGDTNGISDVFVHDRITGITERVNVSSTQVQANEPTFTAVISADGRFVVFESEDSSLVVNDTNRNDIFVHDRTTGITELVSISLNSTPGFSDSSNPSISADGRFVAFTSNSKTLVANSSSSGAAVQVFVRDRNTGITELISVSPNGIPANKNSSETSISANGRFVSFSSVADNLVSGDSNAGQDIFVHDRKTGNTEIVSIANDGAQATKNSSNAAISSFSSISANGRFVVFESRASNLVGADSNGKIDIFIRDRDAGVTERLSVSSTGVQGNDSSARASISADAGSVVFWSFSSNLVDDDSNGAADVFIVKNPLVINLIGQPEVDGANESGVFVWRTDDGRTLMHVVAGDLAQNGQITNFQGGIKSGSLISSLLPIGLESSDSLTQSAMNRVEFSLLAQSPWNDRISFVADINESLCIDLSSYVGGLYLGPDKIAVTPPYDIHAMTSCDNGNSISVIGAPTIDSTIDVGWFIWRDNGVWQNRFVAGGTKHRYQGSLTSTSEMTNLLPISIESNDVLDPLPSTHLSFELTARSPYQDGFGLVVDAAASTCVALDSPSGVNIYMGPDRVLMPRSFDLSTLEACHDAPRIATQGHPNIDRAVDKGIFLWERASNDWSVEVVAGATTVNVIELNVSSQQLLRNIKPISIESNDVFTALPQQLDLSLRVKSPWYDGFRFSAQTQSGSCISTSTPGMPIYLGPNRVDVGSSINLDTQMSCQ